MTAKRISIYLGESLRRLLDGIDNLRSTSGTLSDVADRYMEICRRSRPGLSEAEWSCVVDALNGCWMGDASTVAVAWAEVADHINLNGADHAWDIDGPALITKLQSLDYAGLVAVVDVAERFWSREGASISDILA